LSTTSPAWQIATTPRSVYQENARINEMTAMKVLIVGPTAHRATDVICRFESCACDIWVVETRAETMRLKPERFDFVLSQMNLPDGSADEILRLLEGTHTHMFVNLSFHNDCWWLHVLDRGQNRWWKPTLVSPEDFLTLIDRHARREFSGARRAFASSIVKMAENSSA
jgi:hypothetical protein